MSKAVSLFDQSLSKLNILFKLSGMNLNKKIENVLDSLQHRWLYTFNFLWVLSSTFASTYYIIIGISNGKNFVELTSVAPCVAFTLLAIIKSVFHLLHENHISGLIEKLRDMENRESETSKSVKDEIVNKERAFLNAVINILFILSCLMIVVYDMTPLVTMAVKYYKTKEFEMLLPFLNVFTFIPYEFKYWPFAYVHQIWAECIVLLEMGAVDYFFFTCCTHITIQFKLLQHGFERVVPAQVPSKLYHEDPEFREKFNELVTWHLDLIDLSNKLEIIYSKSTLFNFLSSSLVICLTGFNVTIVDDFFVIVTFMTFLFMGMTQVFFFCFFADMLMRASGEVSEAIYRSHWYVTDISIGKKILLVQIRAQNPCKLTAAGFAEVNLRAFMRVLSTAWSYFALLQTIYGR